MRIKCYPPSRVLRPETPECQTCQGKEDNLGDVLRSVRLSDFRIKECETTVVEKSKAFLQLVKKGVEIK